MNNSSATKVDQNLLFGIVGQSLTPEQLATTEARLNRSGIKVSLIKAAMRVQLQDNPFADMLKTNTPGEPGFLDATAMQRKVIELWYGGRGRNGSTRTLKKFRALDDKPEFSMFDLFNANCSGSNRKERIESWQEERWFDYFRAFWEAVRQTYTPKLWPASRDEWIPTSGIPQTPRQREVHKLMKATILGPLQIAVLQRWATMRRDRLEADGKEIAKEQLLPEKLTEEIKSILKPLTPDFFTDYRMTGNDASKEVRQELIKQALLVLEKAKTVSDLKEEHSAWKKP